LATARPLTEGRLTDNGFRNLDNYRLRLLLLCDVHGTLAVARDGGRGAARAAAEWAELTGRIPPERVAWWEREIASGRADVRTVEMLAPVLPQLRALSRQVDALAAGAGMGADPPEWAVYDALFPPTTVAASARRADEVDTAQPLTSPLRRPDPSVRRRSPRRLGVATGPSASPRC
jgi:hypothetical protein